MLLDLGRNDVGRVAAAGTVKVTESYTVERYSHVMHIVSNVGRPNWTHPHEFGRRAGRRLPARHRPRRAEGARHARSSTSSRPRRAAVYAGGVGYFGA